MLYVCSLREMPIHARTLQPHGLISLVTPAEQPPTPACIAAERHLRIDIDDICVPCAGAILPSEKHIRSVLDGVMPWPAGHAILIHCVAGVSRSMAAALILAATRAPGREAELALSLRRAAPHAQPNRLMIELGDRLLGSGGRLMAAVTAIGPGAPVEYGPLVRLPTIATVSAGGSDGLADRTPL